MGDTLETTGTVTETLSPSNSWNTSPSVSENSIPVSGVHDLRILSARYSRAVRLPSSTPRCAARNPRTISIFVAPGSGGATAVSPCAPRPIPFTGVVCTSEELGMRAHPASAATLAPARTVRRRSIRAPNACFVTPCPPSRPAARARAEPQRVSPLGFAAKVAGTPRFPL